jgi:hypothetical protein
MSYADIASSAIRNARASHRGPGGITSIGEAIRAMNATPNSMPGSNLALKWQAWEANKASAIEYLVNRSQEEQDAATAANEQRYQQGMSLYDQSIAQAMLAGKRAASQQTASAQQSLMSSGLFNTTVAPSVMAGINTQANELSAASVASAMKDKAGFIERREDVAPDINLYASLMKGAAKKYV